MKATMFSHEKEANRRFLQLYTVASLRALVDRPETKAGAALSVALLAFVGLNWDLPGVKLCAAIAGMAWPALYLLCSYVLPWLARRVDLAMPSSSRPSDERDGW